MRQYTLFLVLTLVSAPGAAGDAANSFPTPPATYYGQVLAGTGFTPEAGMTVNAWLADRLCGQDVTIEQEERVVYAVNVAGEGPGGSDGCGALGRNIVFQVGGQFMAPTPAWDNSQLHDLALQPMIPPLDRPAAPEVSIQRSGDDLVLSWLAVGLDAASQATAFTRYRIWRSTRPYFDPALPPCDCVLIADVTSLTHSDTDVDGVDIVGDVNVNYSYIVKAVNAAGESLASGSVGEFDFALAPGSP